MIDDFGGGAQLREYRNIVRKEIGHGQVNEAVFVEVAGGQESRSVAGGKRAPQHGSDLFFEPTVLDGVTDEMEIAREETFGPVVPVTTIESEAEAIALVDGSPYVLLSAIFTRDLRRGLRFAEAELK